jgi:hypothetical protein
MKSPEDGLCDGLIEPLDGTNQRRILGQRKVPPDLVIVGSMGFQDSAQNGPRPRSRCDPSTSDGSGRSAFPHSHSAKVSAARWGDPGCPSPQDAAGRYDRSERRDHDSRVPGPMGRQRYQRREPQDAPPRWYSDDARGFGVQRHRELVLDPGRHRG